MANDIENSKTVTDSTITLSASEGESLDAYLANIHEFINEYDLESILAEGGDVHIVIKGMPEQEVEKEDEVPELSEFLATQVQKFSEANPEFISELGVEALRAYVHQFFEDIATTKPKLCCAASQDKSVALANSTMGRLFNRAEDQSSISDLIKFLRSI